MLKKQMQNEVEALKQHRLLHQKNKIQNNNSEHKCLITLMATADQMWSDQGAFLSFFSVTVVLSNLLVVHMTPDTCWQSHS